ncbi:MAG TPA: hypothetical protein VFR97_10045 [Capillimicrobium sp.]|nr:hypothetical protein [Capillimicrobium sp.]
MPRIRAYEEHPLGLSWIADEAMTRTSHALVDDGRVWLVDPVDVDGAVDRAAALGEPAAVLQLLDRHERDCAAVARRLGVPHVALPHELPGAPLEPVQVVRRRFWNEVALWWPARGALVVPEAVGTNRMFTAGATAVGVHVFLRPTPPRRLAAYAPEHLLVGHGAGVHGAAAAPALREALDRARRDLPLALLKMPTALRG